MLEIFITSQIKMHEVEQIFNEKAQWESIML